MARYRIGNGPAGNVGPRAIRHLVTTVPGIGGVWNPLPATGGVEPESLEEVRQYAPQAFRTQERAVTPEDYARMTERHPDVTKAVATRLWTGSWHVMAIAVDRKGGHPVDGPFRSELEEFLHRFILAGHEIRIDPPRFVPLDVACTVCVEEGFYRGDLRRTLLRIFGSRTLRGGQRGYFHPDAFTFGQSVHLSDLVARAMTVPGVKWIDFEDGPPREGRFRRWGEQSRGELERGRIEMGPFEIARLENDPNAPEQGRLEFHILGGL